MRRHRNLLSGMGFGVLLEGLLAGYRYLGRRLWPLGSSVSPGARLRGDGATQAGG